MSEDLVSDGSTIERHRAAPLFDVRPCRLEHCAGTGAWQRTRRDIAACQPRLAHLPDLQASTAGREMPALSETFREGHRVVTGLTSSGGHLDRTSADSRFCLREGKEGYPWFSASWRLTASCEFAVPDFARDQQTRIQGLAGPLRKS